MKKIFTLFLVLVSASLLRADDYRTVASGLWSNPAHWERFNGSSWVPASTYPTAVDGQITLFHRMTMNLPITIDEVIGTGQALIMAHSITVADGPGDDLVVDSIYTSALSGAGTIKTGALRLGFGSGYQGTGSIQVSRNWGLTMDSDPGTFPCRNSGTIHCLGSVDLSFKQFVGEGTLLINGDLVFHNLKGILQQKFITINGAIRVNAGAESTQIAGYSGGMHNYNGGILLTNNGNLFLESAMIASSAITVNSGSVLTLKGTLGPRSIGSGTPITNNGQFNASQGADVTINRAVTGNGQMFIESINSSRMIFNGGVSGNLKLILDGRAECNNTLATFRDLEFNQWSVLSGNAPIQVSNTANWRDGGPTTGPNYSGSGGLTFMNTCTLNMTSGHKQNNGTITIDGTVVGSFPPSIVGNGTVNVNAPTTFTSEDGRELQNQTFNYNAAHTKTGAGAITCSGTGTFTINNTFTQNSTGAILNGQTFVNNGTLRLQQGQFQQTAGSFTNSATGIIQGIGTLNLSGASSVTNNGTMAPGLSPGVLTVTRAAGVPVNHLQIEVQSNAGPGTGHDQLVVNGPVTLNSGTLTVTRLSGFVPTNGSSYTIMTYSSRTGTFSSVTPSCWTINYGATSATITFNAGTLLYADNDSDGYGNPSISAPACEAPSGYVGVGGDCNDNNPNIYPGAPENCDGLDNDCNGQIDGGSDLAALIAIYNAAGGPNWTDNAGWVDGAAGTNCDPCTWSRVECDLNKRVKRIALFNNNLIGTIANEVGNLTNLEVLYMGDNQLTGSIPSSLGNLSNLSVLHLYGNQLSGAIPSSLGNLSNLTELALGTNQLSGSIPTSLGNLSNLWLLSLSYNQLTGSIPASFANLSNLTHLDIFDNQLTGSIPGFLGDLPLVDLRLQNNNLSGCFNANLSNLCSSTVFVWGNPSLHLGGDFTAFCNNGAGGCGTDADGDGFSFPNDCDDTNSDTYPNAPELCDGLDNDCNPSTPDSHPDLAALVALYNATNGASWTINYGWEQGAAGTDCNVCSWPGVVCDGNGRVSQLFLSAINMTGTLPSEIGNLSELTYLVIEGNPITGNIPASIGNLSNLNILGLIGTQLTGNIPTEIGNLSTLTYLQLNENQLTGNIPASLGNLSNLIYLNLSNNQLGGNIPVSLSNLSNLVELYLSNNQLSGTIPSAFGNLDNVTHFHADNNQLSGVIPAALANMATLGNLSLSNNQLSGNIPAELGSSTIASLGLDNNQLTGNIPAALGNLADLIFLTLNNNQLSGNIPSELGNLSNLQYITLQNNNLSGCFHSNLSNLCGIDYNFSNNPGLHLNGDFAAFCNNGAGGCGTDADGDTFSFPDDCDDTNPDIHPNATEICNGIDDDCDGSIDEGAAAPAQITGTLTFCTGGSTALTASGGTSYEWSNGATTASIVVSAPGTYTVTVDDGNGCPGTATATVTELPLPNASISGNLTFCPGSSTILTASGGGTYAWSTSATTVDITVSSAGIYTVTVTGGNGCTKTATATVSELSLPNAGISGVLSFCIPGSTTLTGTGGVSYSWSTRETTPSITVSTAGTYTVTATGANGCTATATATVTANTSPLILIGGNTFFCAGSTNTLTASGGNTYTWNTGATTASITVNTTGTYIVTATGAGGCTGTAAATVLELPLPNASISGTLTFCPGSSTVLTASGGSNYAWSTGATTAGITASSAGTYTVTVTDGNSCTKTATATVTQLPLPNAGISGILSFCIPGSTTLTGTGGVSYSWSTRATTPSITVSTAGTYTVTATDTNGCTASATATVTSNTSLSPVIHGNTSFCAGGSSILTASGGNTYTWSTGATTAAITVTASGTYTVTATGTGGCTGTASVAVSQLSLPTPSISGSLTFCAGSSTVLTASGGNTYTWSTGVTTAAITVNAAGTYTVTATGANGCTATATATVTQLALPNASISGSLTFCAGGNTILTAAGGGTYAWNTGATTAGITVSSAGTYTVIVTGGNGCTKTATATVSELPLPTASISGTLTFCTGGSTILTASGGGTYVWNTGATTAGITVSSAGTYTVVVTGGNGCTKTATATVSALPLPTASISGTLTFCTGGSTILTASGGGTYVWSTAATTAGITVSSAGTYTVTVTGGNGCTKTATATVTQLALPTPSISGTLSFCAGGSTALTASGGNTYNWSTGATTAATTVSAPGTYTVTATGANGCTASATATVTQLALPTTGISGTLSFCAGSSTVLTASGGASYVWSTGTSTTSVTVNAGGTYTVTATGANGCTATATVAVTQLPLPVPSISGVTNVCAGSNTILTAAGGNTYSWSTGATTASVTVNAAATYTVTATGTNGCAATSTATVVFNTPPNAQITGNTTICAGGIATLTATGGISYSWSTGATTAAINTNVAGAYTVTATGANGCTATASATVTVSNLPFAVSVLGNLAFCTGGNTTLTASGGTSYVWSTGNSTASITVNAGGLYTVTATNSFGCTATAIANVLVKPLPIPLIAASPNACSGSSTVLTASGGTSYTWSTGATTNSITPLSAGTYTVTATNQGGCTATVTANVQASPNITCPSSQTVCAGSTTSLSGSPAGGNYSGAGISGSTFNAAAAGMGTHIITYTVTGTGGCTASCTFTMTVVAAPDAGITAASPVAANSTGNSASVANAGIGATYTWSIVNGTITSGNGTNAITYTAGASGTVSLSVGVGAGSCTATANRNVTIGDGPAMICPASRIVGTDPNACSANLSLTHPVVTGPNPPLSLSVVFGNGSPAPSSVPAGGTVTPGGTNNYVFQSGQTQVTYTAMNGLGQTSTCVLHVTVRDQQNPMLTCPASVVLNTAPAQCHAVVAYATPIASDNCSLAGSALLYGLASGSNFPIGLTTVVWRAGDAAGNVTTCSFSVTVQDNQVPNISCPPNQSLATHPGRCESYALYSAPVASDNCSVPVLTRISGSESGGPFPKGINTIVWQARDATGNTRTCSFRIIVSDNEAPAITCPADFSVNTDFGVCTAVVTYSMATFTDNCPGGSVARIGGLASGSSFPLGTTPIVFRATDAGGRSSTCTLRVTVVDNQPPSMTCPGNLVVTGSGTPCNAQVFYSTPSVTDNCSFGITPFLQIGLASGSAFPAGVTTNVWRAMDGNGLSTDCVFTVTVNCSGPAPRPGGQGVEKLSAYQAPTLRLAPNPAASAVTLTAEGLGEQGGELLMFDALGRLVFQHPVLPAEATVRLDLGGPAFSPGTYRVVLRTERVVVSGALVVVK